MKLDVGVSHTSARPNESAGHEMIGGAMPFSPEQPLQPDQAARHEAGLSVERYRPPRGDLKVKFKVILKVFADARQVTNDGQSERPELLRRADPRELQKFRRIDRSGAQDHLAARPS